MSARSHGMAMVSRQGLWVARSCMSGRATASLFLGAGVLFASVRWSSGIPRIQCQDWRACRWLLIGRDRSIDFSFARRDLMSSDCASETCLVCAGAGTGAVVGAPPAAILIERLRACTCGVGSDAEMWSRFPCIEARGFIFGPAIALAIGAKFIPLRKPKKLPGEVFSESYVLEYGMDCLEMHVGAIEPGERIVVVDDLVATGGTLSAAIRLLERAGANVVECACLIGLPKFKDFYKLNGKPVYILVESRK